MNIVSTILAINIAAIAIYLILEKHNAALVLLLAGLFMMVTGSLLGSPASEDGSFLLFGILEHIIDIFSSRCASVGLMIMLLCGYVEYMRKIKADNAFVYALMHPLSVLRKLPNATIILLIPIGMLLCYAIPSATGITLLLAATVYPILVSAGVSKMNALSVILACTLIDFGFNSPAVRIAAETLGMDIFIYQSIQIKVLFPICLSIIIVYFTYFTILDKRQLSSSVSEQGKIFRPKDISDDDVPVWYAALPALPLIISLIFASGLPFGKNGLSLSLSSAIILSLFIAGAIDMVVQHSFRKASLAMSSFWRGMGTVFSTTIVLIFAADVFSQGMIACGLIDTLVQIASSINLSSGGSTVMMSAVTFASTILTGSGTASITAYSQLVPSLAIQFGTEPLSMMMPVQMVSGIGRAISPISMSVIVLADFADISPFRIVKHNIIPVGIIAILLITVTMISI